MCRCINWLLDILEMKTVILRSCAEELEKNSSNLNTKVSQAQASWDDVNYHHLARQATSTILTETERVSSSFKQEAYLIDREMVEMENIINNLK